MLSFYPAFFFSLATSPHHMVFQRLFIKMVLRHELFQPFWERSMNLGLGRRTQDGTAPSSVLFLLCRISCSGRMFGYLWWISCTLCRRYLPDVPRDRGVELGYLRTVILSGCVYAWKGVCSHTLSSINRIIKFRCQLLDWIHISMREYKYACVRPPRLGACFGTSFPDPCGG